MKTRIKHFYYHVKKAFQYLLCKSKCYHCFTMEEVAKISDSLGEKFDICKECWSSFHTKEEEYTYE